MSEIVIFLFYFLVLFQFFKTFLKRFFKVLGAVYSAVRQYDFFSPFWLQIVTKNNILSKICSPLPDLQTVGSYHFKYFFKVHKAFGFAGVLVFSLQDVSQLVLFFDS